MSGIHTSVSAADIQNARNAVQAFVDATSQKIKSEMLAVAEQAKNVAQGYCPVATGALQASIAVEGLEDDGSSFSVGIGSSLPYAPFVELGHKTRGGGGYVAPQPFLQPAFEEMSAELQKRLQALADGG